MLYYFCLTEAEPLALNALAAAAQTFYTKLLTQLRHNIDMEAMHGHTGFQVHMDLQSLKGYDLNKLEKHEFIFCIVKFCFIVCIICMWHICVYWVYHHVSHTMRQK